jgi:arsenate reductase
MDNCILHNPRCTKSRETLKLIEQQGVEIPVIEYLQAPLTAKQVLAICKLLGKRPLDIVRTKEALFTELGLSKQNGYTDAQWAQVIAEHPKLMERPIVVYNGRAALGRPPEAVLSLF